MRDAAASSSILQVGTSVQTRYRRARDRPISRIFVSYCIYPPQDPHPSTVVVGNPGLSYIGQPYGVIQDDPSWYSYRSAWKKVSCLWAGALLGPPKLFISITETFELISFDRYWLISFDR